MQDDTAPNSLSELSAKLAASDSKRNVVVQIDLAQQKQLKRLSNIILSTIHTEKLTSKKLKAVLTHAEFDDYERRCNAPSFYDVVENGVPSFFDNYIHLMKQADLFNSCANKLEKARHPAYNNGQNSATQMRYKAERVYETAIEC